MAGRELLTLASVPEGNQIFLEVPNPGEDLPVDADAPFDLRPGMKFYDVPWAPSVEHAAPGLVGAAHPVLPGRDHH